MEPRYVEFSHPNGLFLIDVQKHRVLGRIVRKAQGLHAWNLQEKPLERGVKLYEDNGGILAWHVFFKKTDQASMQAAYDASPLKKTMLAIVAEKNDSVPPKTNLPQDGLVKALERL